MTVDPMITESASGSLCSVTVSGQTTQRGLHKMMTWLVDRGSDLYATFNMILVCNAGYTHAPGLLFRYPGNMQVSS